MTVEEQAEKKAEQAKARFLADAKKREAAKAKKLAKVKANKEKAKKAAEAKAKGAQTTALKALAPMAKEINHRLEKADKMVDDAYDHRLAAALQLDAAKKRCAKSKINFKDWCSNNVIQAYETVRKLVAIGGSENPQKALEDMRGKNKAQQKKSRDKAKASKAGTGGSDGQTKKAETPFERIKGGFDAISEEEGRNAVQSVAENYGLAVVEVDQVKALRKASEVLKYGPFEQVKKLFDAASGADKMKIVNYVVGEVGAKLANGFENEPSDEGDDDGLGIPENFKRAPAEKGGRRKKTSV